MEFDPDLFSQRHLRHVATTFFGFYIFNFRGSLPAPPNGWPIAGTSILGKTMSLIV